MHTREPAKYNKPELGSCSCWSRACFSAAHGLRAQPDARRCSNGCATSLPGAGLLCSQQHAMLQTSTALPQQPMPTMMTLRASDAGRPPARTSAEAKCLEAGPCLQRRLWLRALKTPSQHCPTRPGAHLPCSPISPQTCATSNLTRRPHSQMPSSGGGCAGGPASGVAAAACGSAPAGVRASSREGAPAVELAAAAPAVLATRGGAAGARRRLSTKRSSVEAAEVPSSTVRNASCSGAAR